LNDKDHFAFIESHAESDSPCENPYDEILDWLWISDLDNPAEWGYVVDEEEKSCI
jgi:hypothetical protein